MELDIGIDMDRPGYMSTSEIASMLGIQKNTWLTGAREGIFPEPVKLGPRCFRWSRKSIKTFLEQGGIQGIKG